MGQDFYPVNVISFGLVFVTAFQGKIPRMVALQFAMNLVTDLMFMPIFSGLRNLPLATVDIVIVWAAIIWCIFDIWPLHRWVAIVQVPYFAWMSIATVLQLLITAMNWGRP